MRLVVTSSQNGHLSLTTSFMRSVKSKDVQSSVSFLKSNLKCCTSLRELPCYSCSLELIPLSLRSRTWLQDHIEINILYGQIKTRETHEYWTRYKQGWDGDKLFHHSFFFRLKSQAAISVKRVNKRTTTRFHTYWARIFFALPLSSLSTFLKN